MSFSKVGQSPITSMISPDLNSGYAALNFRIGRGHLSPEKSKDLSANFFLAPPSPLGFSHKALMLL